MDLAQFIENETYVVGSLMIISSILTMIITQIIKIILKKKKVIYEDMEKSKKDIILSRIGRIIALIIYTGLYVAKELYLKQTIAFDVALISGLLTGATGTLLIAKAIYTMLHQWSEKNNVYERLEYAENAKSVLEREILKMEEEPKKKWTLTNKKEFIGEEVNEKNSCK